MRRRKGERPVNHPVLPWSEAHPVALDMQGGTPWLDAWTAQTGTDWTTLAKGADMTLERIEALQAGSPPTEDEAASMARAWRTTPEAIAASIAYRP